MRRPPALCRRHESGLRHPRHRRLAGAADVKTSPPQSAITAGRASAIALTIVLFVAGSFPVAGQSFPGATHWIAHPAAYAVLAFAYAPGWQKQAALCVALCVAVLVAALGAIHEIAEIVTHGHALEIADIVVNSAGVATGVAVERMLIQIRGRA